MNRVATIAMFVGLILVLSLPVAAQDYVGSDQCIACHTNFNPVLVENYVASGHPYKLNAVDGAPPTYPAHTSPGLTETPPGTTWDDFAYVIGGYGWKARFVKKDGFQQIPERPAQVA